MKKKIAISTVGILALTMMCSFTNVKAASIKMYRFYNPSNMEHFYTGNEVEKENLITSGWGKFEGVAWYSPSSGTAVYRLYNPILQDHHYTTDGNEVKTLVAKYNWQYEGIAWYSGGEVPVYRLFNPTLKSGSHHYTKDENEVRILQHNGWRYEGVAWYSNNKEEVKEQNEPDNKKDKVDPKDKDDKKDKTNPKDKQNKVDPKENPKDKVAPKDKIDPKDKDQNKTPNQNNTPKDKVEPKDEWVKRTKKVTIPAKTKTEKVQVGTERVVDVPEHDEVTVHVEDVPVYDGPAEVVITSLGMIFNTPDEFHAWAEEQGNMGNFNVGSWSIIENPKILRYDRVEKEVKKHIPATYKEVPKFEDRTIVVESSKIVEKTIWKNTRTGEIRDSRP